MAPQSSQLSLVSALMLATLAITAQAARPFADGPMPPAVDVCKLLDGRGCKGVGTRAFECCADSNLWCDTQALSPASPSTSGICSTCSPCAAGQKVASPCAALSDTVCEACPNAENVDQYADAGKSCEVTACKDGFFKNADGVCVACSAACDLATTGYESTVCSTASDRKCSLCAAESYYKSEADGCVACTAKCGPGSSESTACTTASDRVCTPVDTVESFVVSTLPPFSAAIPAGEWVVSPDNSGAGVAQLTSDAPASALGTSALEFSTTDASVDSARAKAFYPSGVFGGMSFADFINGLDQVTFTMYKQDTGLACQSPQASPAVKFELLNTATFAYTTIVFEPYKSSVFKGAPVTKNTWLTMTAGKDSGSVSCTSGNGWWSTKLGQTQTCAPVALLAALQAAYPGLAYGDAKITSVAVELGSNNKCSVGYVQTLRVASGAYDYTWDFNKKSN